VQISRADVEIVPKEVGLKDGTGCSVVESKKLDFGLKFLTFLTAWSRRDSSRLFFSNSSDHGKATNLVECVDPKDEALYRYWLR
jgi:hypothetical protein